MKDSEKLSHAKALREEGKISEALTILDDIIDGKETKDNLLIIDALVQKADISWRSGKLDIGLVAIERAESLLISEEKKHSKKELQERRGNLLSQRGVIYWYKGELERALECHEECLRIRKTLNDKDGIAAACNNLGLVYWTKGELDAASDFFNKSLGMSRDINDENAIASALNNLANLSSSRGELDQALEYLKQTLEIREKLAVKLDIARTLINIGVMHRLKGDLTQATEYYNRSLAMQEELSIGPDFALALNNLGDIYSLKGNIDAALEFYQRSLLIYDDMGAKEGIALTLTNIGECHERKGNTENAFEYYQRSLSISEDMGNMRLIPVVLSQLMSLALDSGDIDLAKEYLSKLEEFDAQSDNEVLNQRYRISQALFLKKSGRTRDLGKAEGILEKIVEEDVRDYSLTSLAMIHLCDLLLIELKTTRSEEVLDKVKDLTQQLVSIAEDQAQYPLVVETYLLQSKLALIDFEVNEARGLMNEAKRLADEKGLLKLGQIVQKELDTLMSEVKRWETVLEVKPSVKEMVDITNLDDLLARMVQKTVESLGVESKTASTTSKYKLVHKDLLQGTDKSERSKFKVGIAQIGLSTSGDILNELYEEKTDGLVGLKEEMVPLTSKKLRKMIEKANVEGINILIFPEMSIDLSFEQIAKDVESLARQYDMYIIPGSYHDQNAKRNVCRVYGPNGVLWAQEKHTPAIIHLGGKRFIERIDVSTQTKNTFICKTEYGRIAITICRDFLDMDLRVELKNSDPPVDLVINPAFTPVTADFKAAHFDARRSIYAYCFFANIAEFGDSLIYTPERERIDRNLSRGDEGLIYKEVDLFQLRAERKKWEEERKKQVSFIQSTR
ncbi:MAG: tetratricopeptide repeat protein [Candidatus Thorarchaeota archaeon]